LLRASDKGLLSTRRRFATNLLATVAAAASIHRTWGAESVQERRLRLSNLHTNEVVDVTLQDASGFIAESLRKLQHLLRDYRTGEEHEMDSALYVQLSDLARAAGREPAYEVISGYRAPATNAKLRAQGHGVAEHSLHMEGRAMDVRLRGFDLAAFQDLALAAKRGGVGYYPHSNFVHIDTGRVRTWEG
jgi:uncharacterized protein YcbK (DUF882 family)